MKTHFYLMPAGTTVVGLGLLMTAAWLTHLVATVQYFMGGAETVAYGLFLLLGLFVPPLGIVHGVGLWFGAW